MTKLTAMLRVKNEARWLERVIRSIQPLCDPIYLFDDHSTDGTPGIAVRLGCVFMPSPFDGLDESRDKNYILDRVYADGNLGRWILAIDGDEELEEGGQAAIARLVAGTSFESFSFRVLYLWNSPDQVRTDGVYGKFARPSLFRLREGLQFVATSHGGHFHCGNVPLQTLSKLGSSDICLLHYGYMDRAERVRKFEWYNKNDPNNEYEDQYRHTVIGDLLPPETRLKHGGPLTLEPVDAVRRGSPVRVAAPTIWHD